MDINSDIDFTKENFQLLLAMVIEQQETIAGLNSKIKKLEGQQAKDSSNSSKPPSSDGLAKKPKSQRKRSGKSQGGQTGHQGKTLRFTGPAQRTVHCLPSSYENICDCGIEFLEQNDSPKSYHKVTLPKLDTIVSEHALLGYHCSRCGRDYDPDKAPNGNPVQYGDDIAGLATYLNQYQLIPYRRVQSLFKDIFNLHFSTGTLVNFVNRTAKGLVSANDQAKQALIESPVVHCDETSIRVNGQNHWMHVCSNNEHAVFHVDQKRGTEAIDRLGVLPLFKGVAVHDRWSPYFQYDCQHSLCNAHLLRELQWFIDTQGLDWAKQVIELLLRAKQKVDTSTQLPSGYSTRISNRFKEIVRLHLQPQECMEKKSRGKPKKTPEQNFLYALNKHHRKVLAFLTNPQIPFDNNMAERDLRMIKVKMKVSGSFRSLQGPIAFAIIRGAIAKATKQKLDVFEQFKMAFT